MTDCTTGLLPETVATEVLTAAEEQSAVMSLARILRMPSGITSLPLVEVAPSATWLDAAGDRKPFSAITWSAAQLVAREVALTTFIEDAYLQDATWNPEREAEREMSAAIAKAVDGAVLFGDPQVAGFPTGGIVGTPVTGADALDALTRRSPLSRRPVSSPTGSSPGRRSARR